MKAKTYLKQIERLNIQIGQKQQQINELKTLATGSGSISYGERVQTSLSGNSNTNIIVEYVYLEKAVNSDIDNYVNIKNKIINQIQSLHSVEQIKLLYMRYVLFYTFEKIAVEMNLCTRQIYRIHRNALQAFQKILDE